MRAAAASMGGIVAGVTLGLVVFGGEPGHIIIGVSLTIWAFVLVLRAETEE